MTRLPSWIAAAAAVWAAAPLFAQNTEFCNGNSCPGKNPKVRSYRMILQSGARPRWSPSGDMIVFDRPNADGNFDVYLANTSGTILRSLTENRPGIGQRNNGNAVFHPSGNYVVFISEASVHYLGEASWLGDPGLGLFSNLWATDLNGNQFWQLTQIPIKIDVADPTPAYATVNPVFTPDGSQLVWTERYANGGNLGWGRWRLKFGRFVTSPRPTLLEDNVFFTPRNGNYVTAMGFLDFQRLIAAGNLDGQHEFGMDQYSISLNGADATNLTGTPDVWEEGSCVSPNRQYVVYMSNATSRYPLDFQNPNWHLQPTEREYFLMRADGSQKEQLTYFNDPSAPEYLGGRTHVAACSFSPDGRYIASTMVIDRSTGPQADLVLKIALIELSNPAQFASLTEPPVISQGGVANGASFTSGIAAGSWVTIAGTNLSATTRVWANSDFDGNRLPTQLDGVSVTINGKPTYIAFISPTQINVLSPDDPAVGPVSVQVRTAAGVSNVVQVNQSSYSPALFRFAQENARYAAAVHLNGGYLGKPNLIGGADTTPARSGELILLFGTGFGPTNPPLPTGELSGPAPLASQVNLRIGGVPATIQFAGTISPGLVQFNVYVPNLGPGDHAITGDVQGVPIEGTAFITIAP